ncbi:restriction endonuclease subunit S [Mycoplasma sp. BRA290]|uniref:restriction endonuclease subunit S n=1 Tax=Mycoplasma sp. BRA290 TaxID=3401675 RepID=UPI003AABE5EF
MLDKKMAPEIRFKGYKEDWKESKIGNFLSIPIEEKVDVNNASQLLTLGLNLSGLKNGATKNKLHFGATNYFLRKEGQFIYGKQNFFNGSMAIITPEFDNKASSKDVPSFNVNNIDNWFFYYYLARPSFYEKTEDLSLGTGSKRIHENILFNISIAHPELLEEQKKIRSLISNLNSIVSFNSIKLNKLRVIKQSLLDKMFTDNTLKYPKIQFKDFDKEWKTYYFSEIIYPSGEKNINNLILKSYSVSNKYGFINQEEQFKYGGIALAADKSRSTVVDCNTFAYNPARIDIGSIGYWDKDEKILISPMYEVFKTNKNFVNDTFLMKWFKTEIFNSIVLSNQEGGVRTCFSLQKMLSSYATFPTSVSEQQKIGQFFSNLDSLIHSQEQKLEKLNNIKQALLEKMFC